MIRTTLTALIALVAAPALAQGSSTPDALVRSLYSSYREGGIGMGDPKVLALMTPTTRAALQRAQRSDNDEIIIDADPFCDCQDFTEIVVGGVRVTKLAAGRATARVWLTDREEPERRDIRLDLRRTAQGWRIHDAGPVDGWSLLKQLSAGR